MEVEVDGMDDVDGLETRAEQGYWFREIRAHKPQWAAQIGARVAGE